MRIGICDSNEISLKGISHWIREYCLAYGVEAEIAEFRSSDAFFRAASFGRFSVVFMGFAGPEGFSSARRLCEMDSQVKQVFIGDTDEYAVRGVRLRFSDYIVRPVEFKHIVRAMRLAGVAVE